ncbi:unnamed protein product [Effrenium voratum]|uniref:Uncharacterized protein n=1 Tax=Effrenium voratum TaxID=2562239 RepID=A0AA36J1I1_9DINO|nr:unnamed protein product [Effrenium voratum]
MGETREALFAALGAKSFWRWPAEGFELGSDSAKATLRGLQLHDFRTGLDRWLKVSAKCADRSTATRMAYFHGFSRGGSGYAPDFEGNESSDDEAAGVTCARPGCSKPPWNGAQGEYCGKSCRDSSTSAAPTAAAAGVTCARPGCSKPSWNGAQGEYCGKSCRDSSTSAAPTAAAASQAGASCVPATQQQFDSVKQQFQKSWNTGSPPQIRAIFKIHASSAVATAYHSKCSSIGPMAAHGNGSKLANQQRRFHGTRQSCAFSGQPCTNPGCRACSIIRGGFQIKHLSANTQNRWVFVLLAAGGYVGRELARVVLFRNGTCQGCFWSGALHLCQVIDGKGLWQRPHCHHCGRRDHRRGAGPHVGAASAWTPFTSGQQVHWQ